MVLWIWNLDYSQHQLTTLVVLDLNNDLSFETFSEWLVGASTAICVVWGLLLLDIVPAHQSGAWVLLRISTNNYNDINSTGHRNSSQISVFLNTIYS